MARQKKRKTIKPQYTPKNKTKTPNGELNFSKVTASKIDNILVDLIDEIKVLETELNMHKEKSADLLIQLEDYAYLQETLDKIHEVRKCRKDSNQKSSL